MKVLLAPLGSRGDVQPQLVLGEELSRRGHTVTVAGSPDFNELVESYGLRFHAIGEPILPLMRRNADMTELHPAAALPRQLKLMQHCIEQQVTDLLSTPLDADIVIAAGLSFGGKLLADRLGIPHVFCHYALSALRSRQQPALPPVFGRLPSAFTLFDSTLGTTVNRLRRKVGLRAHQKPWLETQGTESILAQDSVMGKLPDDVPGHVVHVPAFVPADSRARALPGLLERFLRGSVDASPVIYLGFGSMPRGSSAGIVEIAVQLFEQHGARVVLFSSYGEDTSAELPRGVFVCRDADHAALFPRLDLIVHHGGAGITATALRSGVPQLIVPHTVDQSFHGLRIAELGVGPDPVLKSKLSAAVIAEALQNRFTYWAKAQIVRASVVPEGGARQAADYLETLAGGRPGQSMEGFSLGLAALGLAALSGQTDMPTFRRIGKDLDEVRGVLQRHPQSSTIAPLLRRIRDDITVSFGMPELTSMQQNFLQSLVVAVRNLDRHPLESQLKAIGAGIADLANQRAITPNACAELRDTLRSCGCVVDELMDDLNDLSVLESEESNDS